jgi:hypothetical protein
MVKEANVAIGFAFLCFTMASFIKPYTLIEKEGKSQTKAIDIVCLNIF